MAGREAAKLAIEACLAKIAELEAIIEGFEGDNDALHRSLNEYVEALRGLQESKDALVSATGEPIEVPVELLRYLDDGGNPDTFTADTFRSALAANQATAGKVAAFRELQGEVMARLKETRPALAADYEALRSTAGQQQQPAGGGGAG